MSLTSPLDLLWLPPILGGIIALWMLRVKRKEQMVSSLYLWRRVTPTAKADTPIQRLRRNILLFLQLAGAFLLILALTHPMIRAAMPAGTRYVVVIDASASMSATDVTPDRLTAALASARQFLATSVKRYDRVTVIESAGPPRILAQWTPDGAKAAASLDEVSPTDVERNIPAAVTLARTQIGAKTGSARIVIFSDGAWDVDQDSEILRVAGKVPVALVAVGSDRPENVGITGIDCRRDIFGANRRQVFVRVRNFGDGAVTGKVDLAFNGTTVAAQSMTLQAGLSEEATFSSPALDAGGVATARLDGFGADDLSSDNSASIALVPERRMRILLVTGGNLFLEKGLALDPDVDLYEITPDQYDQIHGRYDLQVFDDYAPASLPPGNFLIFHAVGQGMPVDSTGEDVQNPAIVDWNSLDPLMRFVDFGDVHVASAASVRALDWGQTVVDGDSGPLIVSGERLGRRCVWVGFTTAGSDLALKVSFPIFLTNATEWLTGSDASGSLVRAGQPITLPSGSGQWRVRAPLAPASEVDCGHDSDSVCIYPDTGRVGLYRFRAEGGAGAMVYAVNTDSERSSDITPRDHPGIEAQTTASESGTRLASTRSDIWEVVAFVALALLVIEWMVYHRRS